MPKGQKCQNCKTFKCFVFLEVLFSKVLFGSRRVTPDHIESANSPVVLPRWDVGWSCTKAGHACSPCFGPGGITGKTAPPCLVQMGPMGQWAEWLKRAKKKNPSIPGFGWGGLAWPESESARNFMDKCVYEKFSAKHFFLVVGWICLRRVKKFTFLRF